MNAPPLTPQSALVTVDIVSDIVCPWCWLGARYFQDAARRYSGKVKLVWHPYMLDPSVPAGGMPYRDYMKTKFGDAPSSRWKAMRDHLETAGPMAGIDFRFSDIPMRPNTLNAHRVMRWASGQDKAGAMAEALFKAFFTDHKDVGDNAVLAALAKDAGLDAAVVADLLATDKDITAVENEIAHVRQLGISGVPTFIYNGQFAVQGAQPSDKHLNALAKASAAPEN